MKIIVSPHCIYIYIYANKDQKQIDIVFTILFYLSTYIRDLYLFHYRVSFPKYITHRFGSLKIPEAIVQSKPIATLIILTQVIPSRTLIRRSNFLLYSPKNLWSLLDPISYGDLKICSVISCFCFRIIYACDF